MSACSVCAKVLYSKQVLERHMLIHSGRRPFVCTVCNKGFTRQDNLRQHILIHEGLKPFKCDYCDYAATGSGSVVRHIERVHLKKQFGKAYQCEICEKSFSERFRLNMHVKRHTGIGLLNCEFCHKVFTTKYDLDFHMTIHTRTEKDKFPCDSCGKTFAWKKGVSSHKAIYCRGNASSDDRRKNIDGGSKIKRKRGGQSKSRVKKKSDRGRKSGVKPQPGRGVLTCRLCQGEFLSLPEMYEHQCSGKPGSDLPQASHSLEFNEPCIK